LHLRLIAGVVFVQCLQFLLQLCRGQRMGIQQLARQRQLPVLCPYNEQDNGKSRTQA